MAKTKRIRKTKNNKKVKRKPSTTSKKKSNTTTNKKSKAKKYNVPGQRKPRLQDVKIYFLIILLIKRIIQNQYFIEVFIKKIHNQLWHKLG